MNLVQKNTLTCAREFYIDEALQGQNDESELSQMSIFVLYPKTITWIFTIAYGAMLWK